MASFMPTIPRFFFLYVEPALTMFGGALTPVLNPHSITTLLPASLAGRHTTTLDPTPLEQLLALQSATLMFMISLLTLSIMLLAQDRKIVHAYIWISAITDLPHWTSFFYVLGWEGVGRWREWEQPLWLQICVPVVTMGFKLGYLAGLFGGDGGEGGKGGGKRL